MILENMKMLFIACSFSAHFKVCVLNEIHRHHSEGGDRTNEIPTFSRGPSGLRDLMSFHVSPKSCRPRVQLWLPVPPYPRWQSDQSEFFGFSMPGIFWKVTIQAFALLGFFHTSCCTLYRF